MKYLFLENGEKAEGVYVFVLVLLCACLSVLVGVSICLQKCIQVQFWQRLLPIGETAVLRTVKSRGRAALSREHREEMFHQFTEVAVPVEQTKKHIQD